MVNCRLFLTLLGALCGVILLLSCKKSSQASNTLDNDSTRTNASNSSSLSINKKTTFWSGTVNGHPFKLYLRVEDTLANGQAYFADADFRPLDVLGAIRADSLILDLTDVVFEQVESGYQHNQLAQGKLHLAVVNDQLRGRWLSDQVAQSTPVTLNRTPLDYQLSHVLRKYAKEQDQVSLEYLIPQLAIKAKPEVEKVFKEKVTTAYEQDFQSKKDSVQSWLKSQAVLRKDNPGIPQSGYGEHSDYRVTLATPSVLSLQQQGYFFTGGAHGMPWIAANTFDMRSGRVIELDGLFKTGFDYRLFIWNYCRKELQHNYGLLQPGDEWDKQPEAFSCFYFTTNALVIQFQAYEVGPYVAGMPNVSIPYSSLKPHLNPSNNIIQMIERER
jgi:hypothetical protein